MHAELLTATDGEGDVKALAAWARVIGVSLSKHGELYSWRWNWERLRRVPPGLSPSGVVPEEGRAHKRGTFSRYKALGNEALEYFAPGHPLVDALARDALQTTDGRASVFACRLDEALRGGLYLHVVFRNEVDPGEELRAAGLLHRALTHLWMQVRSVWIRLHPTNARAPEIVERATEQQQLEKAAEDSPVRIDRDDLAAHFDVQALWKGVEAGVDAARQRVTAERAEEVAYAAAAIKEDFKQDFSYLESVLARSEGSEKQEALGEIETRNALLRAVSQERPVLEGLALLIPAP